MLLILYFLAINALAAALFFYDKRQSRSGGWRIPENTLLGIAILGGSIGAKIAQQKFRHKTHKQPFANILNGIGLFNPACPCAGPPACLYRRWHRIHL
jgi:uncharacterized membrane protein YsdA (DUF1294 family)